MKRMINALYETRDMTEDSLRIEEDKITELCNRQEEIRVRMLSQMSAEAQALFRKYLELEAMISIPCSKTYYAQGFRDGLRMGAWALMREEDREA